MATGQYDPKAVTLTLKHAILGSHTVRGYVDGTFIVAERSDDLNMMTPGAQGDTMFTLKRNRNGTITITLQMGSATNSFLSKVVAADEISGTGVITASLKDNTSGSVGGANVAKVQKHSNMEYSNESTQREWVLLCPELELLEGEYPAL